MNYYKYKIPIVLSLLILTLFTLPVLGISLDFSNTSVTEIENYIQSEIKKGNIPGMSVVIVKDDQIVYSKGFGYADLSNKTLVSSKTLFELGSTSKAFTALAILKLEKEGLISIDDSVDKHLPWFMVKYNGEPIPLKLRYILNHTSGIPTWTIANIKPSTADNALEETVKTLVGMELVNEPGKTYQYATINYDILGLIIEKVSGKKFEEYMKENIFKPLGLTDTTLDLNKAKEKEMAKGYKLSFKTPREYKAPVYRGNWPAGYVISNADDLGKWMITQLGYNKYSTFDQDLIEKSHQPLNNEKENYYTMGWNVEKDMIHHSGSNPNFSSVIILRPEDKLGIAVLANLNSARVVHTGFNILNLIGGRSVYQGSDFYEFLDRISALIVYITGPLFILLSGLICWLIIKIKKGKRQYQGFTPLRIIGFIIMVFVLLITGFACYQLPQFLQQVPWSFAVVWSPFSLPIAIILLFITVLMITIFVSVVMLTKKTNENVLKIKGSAS